MYLISMIKCFSLVFSSLLVYRIDDTVIAILGVIGVFILPVILIGFIFFLRINEKKKRYTLEADLYVKAIENGIELPKNVFQHVHEKKSKKSHLEIGVILLSAGIGISLFFLLYQLDKGSILYKHIGIGFIPIFCGIGYLLLHFLEKRQNRKIENE